MERRADVLTPVASRAFRELRTKVRAPEAQNVGTAWPTIGGWSAALTVALFGAGAFWAADPELAAAAIVATPLAGAAGWGGKPSYYGDSGSSSSSSSCGGSSSSSSCGGGGGGGGCGGGGGGCGG